jgi:tetratricopeptide (TPR) repeat protein
MADALNDATDHFTAGRFQKAVDAAKQVDDTDDAKFARSRYLMGEIQYMLGDREAAERSLRAALAKKRASAPILTALGRVLIDQEETDEALRLLKLAVKQDPKSGRARTYLGLATYQDTLGKKGMKDVKAGIKLAPKDPEVARAVVLVLLDAGSPAPAAKEAKRFAKARSDHPMGAFLHALIKEREGEFDKAIKLYEQAIKADDTFLDAHKNLAILCITQNPMYENKERTIKAFKHFKRYEDLGGRDEKVKRIHATLKSFFKQQPR